MTLALIIAGALTIGGAYGLLSVWLRRRGDREAEEARAKLEAARAVEKVALELRADPSGLMLGLARFELAMTRMRLAMRRSAWRLEDAKDAGLFDRTAIDEAIDPGTIAGVDEARP